MTINSAEEMARNVFHRVPNQPPGPEVSRSDALRLASFM